MFTNNSGVTGTPTNYLDMSASTLTSGLLYIGSGNTTNSYIKFGSSLLHSVNLIQRLGTGTANIIDMGGSTIISSGDVNFTGINVTKGTSTFIMTGTSTLTSAGQSFNNLTYNSSGTLTLADNTIISGNFNISAGTLSPGTTTVTMNGGGKILATNSQTLNNFEVAGNTTLGSNLILSGNLTIDSGKTLDTSSSNHAVTLGGNWTNSGTFSGNNSLVTLNSSNDHSITGSNTFYQLTASATGANRTLTFANGSTQTVSNALSLNGLGGNNLILRSDSPGHSWNITPNGSRTIDHVDVQDSANTVVSTPIIATNSMDSGNNTSWTITAPPLTVSVQAASSLTITSALLNGNITATGGTNSSERGFNLYNGSICSGGIIQNPKDIGGSYGIGTYSKTVTNLSNNTDYSYIAYAVNPTQTSTSTCQSFTTLGSIYYIVSGTNVWVRGSISDSKDIANQYVFQSANNNEIDFNNTYIISSTTPNTVLGYQTGTSLGSNYSQGDDTAPINTKNVNYIMAGHGLLVPVITSTGHDKTSADIGSTWSDGTHQFLLVEISGSALTFYSIPYNDGAGSWRMSYSVAGTLAHVSGATHTTNITVTSQTSTQKYPVVKNLVRHILVNGITEATDGSGGYADYVDLVEEFDLIDPSTMVLTNNPFNWNDATSTWMHVKNTYHAVAGGTIIHSEFSIQRPLSLGYIGFIQTVGMSTTTTYQNAYVYIPKANPVSVYDFKTISDFSAAPATSLSIISNNVNSPIDRQINLLKKQGESNYDIGLAFGYSPYLDTAAANRNCSGGNGCWWIYTSKKAYPAVDGGIGLINGGTTYDMWGYKQWVDPKATGVNKLAYWNNQNGHDLVYIDFHKSVTNDATVLPSKYTGKIIRVVESENITLNQNTVPADGIKLSTTASNTYGFGVFELSDAPTVSVATPINGSTATGTITLSASATSSDTIGVAGVHYVIDGVNYGNEVTIAPYNLSWDTIPYADNNSHSIVAVVRDNLGNYATSSPADVTVSYLISPQTIATLAVPPSHSSSGGSTQSQVNNLIAMGNYTLAGEIAKRYGITIPSNTLPQVPAIQTSSTSFTRDLKLGMKGLDVKLLQQFLNTHGFPVSKKGIGSKGRENTTFGPATKAALVKFQRANKITPAVGYFGSVTRGVVGK